MINQENLKKLIDLLDTKNVGFISMNRYTNVDGEKTKRRINLFSYEKAKSIDLETLRKGVEYIPSTRYTKADWDIAIAELVEGIVNPDEKRSKALTDAFVTLTKNNDSVKYCFNTQEIYIMGLELDGSKQVIESGKSKTVNSAPKTIAKNVIRRTYLKSGLIRSFKTKEIGFVKLKGELIGGQEEIDLG